MVKHLRLWAGPVLLALASSVTAQSSPRAYAVVSEVAREVSVVIYQESTGSLIGNNMRQRIAVPEDALDKVVLVGARQALQKAEPGARIWLIAPTDTELFEGLQNATEGERVAIPADLAAALRQNGSTHLLLFTRYRSDAQLRGYKTMFGSGRLEGLGFYVDRHTPGYIPETGDHIKGFLAPYTYFRATLIDAATAKVLHTRTIAKGVAVSSSETTAGKHAWDVWTPAQKMTSLRDMLMAEVAQVVAELAAAR
ncbi:MAG: hypothetical protein Q8K45_00855 [Rubrivivax sp.]|nr:hypothetical protein [Rubrivivax sp.]